MSGKGQGIWHLRCFMCIRGVELRRTILGEVRHCRSKCQHANHTPTATTTNPHLKYPDPTTTGHQKPAPNPHTTTTQNHGQQRINTHESSIDSGCRHGATISTPNPPVSGGGSASIGTGQERKAKGPANLKLASTSKQKNTQPLAVVIHGALPHYKQGMMRRWIEEDNEGVEIMGIRWLLKDFGREKVASCLVSYLTEIGDLKMGRRHFRTTRCDGDTVAVTRARGSNDNGIIEEDQSILILGENLVYLRGLGGSEGGGRARRFAILICLFRRPCSCT